MTDLDALRAKPRREGRRCAVGALIRDAAGRVFVHRRGWNRAIFPGCWDIAGGHVEPGESLLAALSREVAEETGWQVAGTPRLIYVADWEAGGQGRREFDFLTEVAGDLAHPRLELPKHIEWRWLDRAGATILAENRGSGDAMVAGLVGIVHRICERADHVTAFLGEATAVEALRARWDPVMADQITAHVTIAYPGAFTADARRIAEAAQRAAPFRLRLGAVRHWGRPEAGVFVEVEDVDGGWAALRRGLTGRPVPGLAPHVTIVHPRTTNRGAAAWPALAGHRIGSTVIVRDVAAICWNGSAWALASRFRLGLRA